MRCATARGARPRQCEVRWRASCSMRHGEPLYVQGAVKGQRRYRYYVSRRLVRGESQEPEQQWRLSAPEIEPAVTAGAPDDAR